MTPDLKALPALIASLRELEAKAHASASDGWRYAAGLTSDQREYYLALTMAFPQIAADVAALVAKIEHMQKLATPAEATIEENRRLRARVEAAYPDTEADGVVFCGKCGGKR